MPYSLSAIAAFQRSVKNLDPQQKETIKLALNALMVYFVSDNNLLEAQQIAPRFFIKQLRKPFYEIGIESRLRIVLRKDDNSFVALFAGNHDTVRRFLAKSA